MQNQQVVIIPIPQPKSFPQNNKWRVIMQNGDQYEVKQFVSSNSQEVYVNDILMLKSKLSQLNSQHFQIQNEVFKILIQNPQMKQDKHKYLLTNVQQNLELKNNTQDIKKQKYFQQFTQLKNFILAFIPQADQLMKDIHEKSLYNPDVKQRYKYMRQNLNDIPQIIKKFAQAVEINIDSGKIDIDECSELSSRLQKLKENFDILQVHIQAENQDFIRQQSQQKEQQQQNIIQNQQQLPQLEQEYPEAPQSQIQNQNQQQPEIQIQQNSDINENQQHKKIQKPQKINDNQSEIKDEDLILDLSQESDNQDNKNEEVNYDYPKEEDEDENIDKRQSQISQKEEIKQEENAQEACIICMDKKVSYACIPCGHFKYCEDCQQIIIEKKECMLCRQPVVSVVKIFT